MSNHRKTITAGELYVMMDREFRMRQSRDCGGCYILLPYRIDQPDHSNANWEIVPPAECAYGCALIIEDLVDKYSQAYDLSADAGN